MKKITVLLTILALIALLAACGGSAEGPAANDTQAENVQLESEPGEDRVDDPMGPQNFELPLQTTLIVGTFSLEGTTEEVTAEQAAELLPLWQVLKTLLESDTAAAAEVEALTNQIADTMTVDQMAAIEAMSLTVQELQALNQELGLNEGFVRPEAAEAGEPGTGRPEGMGPGMGPGGGQGETGLTPEQIESMQATREAGGGGFGGRGGMMNTELIEALIELLQGK